MICPKCKSENQFGNFCSECGNRLKEKCPECGEMEPIRKKVCETKMEEAMQRRKEYLQKNVGDWREMIGRMYGFSFSIVGVIYACVMIASPSILFKLDWETGAGLVVFFLVAGSFIVCFLILNLSIKFQKQAEQKATQKFLQEHPEYAEILRKAEEK